MAAGVDLLIEKPLAASLAEADRFWRWRASMGAWCRWGIWSGSIRRSLRCGLLNRPMFFEVHRLSVFTPRSLDVDVVLDLMIHDLDIVLSLVARRCARCARWGCRCCPGRWTSPMCGWSLRTAAWRTLLPAG